LNKAALGIASILLSTLLNLLVFSNMLQAYDASLFLRINGLNLPQFLNELNIYASLYGREYFWGTVLVLIFLLGDSTSRKKMIELAILFAIGIMLGDIIKGVEFRPRPFETLQNVALRVRPDFDSSFPSGHALIVSIGATYGLISFNRARFLSILLAFEAAFVCFSRVYVGVHYPLDVVGGIFLGISIAFIGDEAIRRYAERKVLQVVEYFSRRFAPGFIKV
jgi:membrane-associated phospholipid phosphatase